MHNKLALGNSLHQRNGLAAAVVDAASTLTVENERDMAAALLNPIPQWRGGTKLMLDARFRRDHGDQFWYQ